MILVTGNRGYIGVRMTYHLKAASYQVRGIDRGWFQPNFFFPLPKDHEPHEQLEEDIRNLQKEELNAIEAVIHLAALSNDPLGALDEDLTFDINERASIRLATLAKERGVKRFVFASSCSLYGVSENEQWVSETGKAHPLTAYARSKWNAEKEILALADERFCPTILRNATVYGLSPYLRLDLVVNQLTAQAFLNHEIILTSDGTPWRPLIHIDDFCRTFLRVLKSSPQKVSGQVFNVGCNDENYQVHAIAQEVAKQVPEVKVKIDSDKSCDERSYRVDFSKLKHTFCDFSMNWNLQQGITQLLQAYTAYGLKQEALDQGKFYRLPALLKKYSMDQLKTYVPSRSH